MLETPVEEIFQFSSVPIDFARVTRLSCGGGAKGVEQINIRNSAICACYRLLPPNEAKGSPCAPQFSAKWSSHGKRASVNASGRFRGIPPLMYRVMFGWVYSAFNYYDMRRGEECAGLKRARTFFSRSLKLALSQMDETTRIYPFYHIASVVST